MEGLHRLARGGVAGMDFFTAEVLTWSLATYYALVCHCKAPPLPRSDVWGGHRSGHSPGIAVIAARLELHGCA
jgi:hypothetical protein